MEIKTFGVIGAGQMGGGIAQVAATSGLSVIISDISEECTAKGLAAIEKNLKRSVEKQKLTRDQCEAILARLKTTTDIGDMAQADYVVEAAVEMEELKFNIFRQLDEACAETVILASNTSSIPIRRMAAQTQRREKFIGLHFLNPVPVMQLVEVIRGWTTGYLRSDVGTL